jgi:hypothetical protein
MLKSANNMKYLTQEEKAAIVLLIGLRFVKEDNQIQVVLDQNSKLVTPYTYHALAMVIIAKLNAAGNQERFRLRKVLKDKLTDISRSKIISILQLNAYLKYASVN